MDRERPRELRWRWRSLAALWVLAFSFYALTGPGHTSSWDASLMISSARNFLAHRDLSVPAYPGTELLRKTGVGGREYVKFAPGFIFAHLPMLVAARLAGHLPLLSMPGGERPARRTEDEFWAELTNAWITSSLLVLLAVFVTDLGGSRRDAWMVVWLVGLAGPLWIYTKADGSEALQALSLLGTCYFLRRARLGEGASLPHWIAGAFCGLAILTKTFNALLAPIFLAALLASPRSRRLAPLGAFLAPIAAAVALTGLYNQARFGSPFDSGYDLGSERFSAALLPGMLKLLFSPSYGLLLFWPASALALLGVRRQWRAHPADTFLIVAIFLALLLLYSRWWAFSGFGWGPRFLIPAVPLLALLALPVVSSSQRAARTLTAVCLAGGLAVQGLAATTNHWQQVLFGVYRQVDCGDYAARCMDDPRVAPLRVAWWRVRGAVIRARHPEELAAFVEASPWSADYPWLWPETLVERQKRNTGLDFWAAPPRWRLERTYLWSPSLETPVPSSPPLAALLVVILGGSLVVVLRDLEEGASGGQAARRSA